ncbi:hypothetical protein MPSEU_000776600 [Mayamaea pseudoterrestris]|nr:hypothetical protein MPSEU_000776600 [Mayamaea pseudoterrestris]
MISSLRTQQFLYLVMLSSSRRLLAAAFQGAGRTSSANARYALKGGMIAPAAASYLVSPFDLQSRLFSSTVESDQELDAALENLFDQIKVETDREVGAHIPNSKPFPDSLTKTEPELSMNDLSIDHPQWHEIGIDAKILNVLKSKDISHFTPVQATAMKPVLARRDIIGRSRTGTGKTLAFGIPGILRVVEFAQATGKRDESGRMKRGRTPSMIVLCPTRELARQVYEELDEFAKLFGLYSTVFHGGVSYDPQARDLKAGIDILIGTPGRIMDHLNRGTLSLDACDIAVLDEADEMLRMGFAEDVEVILDGVGQDNPQKTQCLLFSATTPSWVKDIGRKYQQNVLHIDSTEDEGGARVAKTVRHLAVQVPPGIEAKKSILEDIIAVEISRDAKIAEVYGEEEEETVSMIAMRKKKANAVNAFQQKLFGKTIVFTETKKVADEIVSGGVFKSLTAAALHGDVGQKQRDATLNAFRAGAFNVLVATDVAARGIDIKDVDLVVQLDPPRDVDTYVHRSGRTGRAGASGVSIMLFSPQQARDVVRIERDLGKGFTFNLVGPPSTEAALHAAAKTSALACKMIPEETAEFFKESAALLLEESDDPVDVVSRCLAAISRRSREVESRSLLTGELGMTTVEMSNSRGRIVSPNDVVYTISKLASMSRREEGLSFESDIGRIVPNAETGAAVFDMDVDNAKKLVAFCEKNDSGGNEFKILRELEVERGINFGKQGGRGGGGGGKFSDRRGGPGGGYGGSRGPSRGYDSRGRGGPPGRSTYNKYDRNGSKPERSSFSYGNRRPDQGGERGGYKARYERGSSGTSFRDSETRQGSGGW